MECRNEVSRCFGGSKLGGRLVVVKWLIKMRNVDGYRFKPTATRELLLVSTSSTRNYMYHVGVVGY